MPHTEASVTCPVWITQSTLDGLSMLNTWLEGFHGAGKGQVPGHHELVMFYRTLRSAVAEHYKKTDADESVEVQEVA